MFGHFNPSITTLAWLERHAILSSDEATSARVEIDGTATAIAAGALILEITLDRFLIQTNEESQIARLPDAVALIFGALPHTPVDTIALGFDGELELPDAAEQQAILDRFTREDLPAGLDRPLARSATVRLPSLSSENGVAHLTIEDLDLGDHALYVSLVDEADLPERDADEPGARAAATVRERWELFVKKCENIAERISGA